MAPARDSDGDTERSLRETAARSLASGDATARWRAFVDLAACLAARPGRAAEADGALRDALATAMVAGRDDLEWDSRRLLATAARDAGDLLRACSELNLLVRRQDARGDARGLASSLRNRAALQWALGRKERALQDLALAEAAAEEAGDLDLRDAIAAEREALASRPRPPLPRLGRTPESER